jgi:hypothetical protein
VYAQDFVAIDELLLPTLRALAQCIRNLHALLEMLNILSACLCVACVSVCVCETIQVTDGHKYFP